MNDEINCPCGSGKKFQACCAVVIADPKCAKTTEALMRSRYTAYTQANIEHIEKTMAGPALEGFDREAAEAWAKNLVWQGLVVHESKTHNKTSKGSVKFTASFIADGQLQQMQEHSLFEKIDGRWFYVDRR